MRPTQIVEATLFASQSPLTTRDLARADESLTESAVEEALVELREAYESQDRAFQIYNLGDGYQILTRPEYAPYLERFDSVPRTHGLSGAALETLAIIAYRQPISRVEIEDIRGVGSATVLRTLQEWELAHVVGRAEGLGRPLLYGTTQRLLDHFGLRDLSDLPRLEDLPVTLQAERTLEVPPESHEEPSDTEEAESADLSEEGLPEAAVGNEPVSEAEDLPEREPQPQAEEPAPV